MAANISGGMHYISAKRISGVNKAGGSE